MKLTSPSVFLLILIFSVLSAVNTAAFEVEMLPVKDVITENQVGVFNLIIREAGSGNRFEIFTLNTDFVFPGETIYASGEPTQKEIRVFPQVEKSGLYGITFFIKNLVTEDIREANARVKVVLLKDAVAMKVEPSLLHVGDEELTFVVRNTAETAIDNLKLEAESPIFTDTFEFSLEPKGDNGEKRFSIPVDLTKAEGGKHNIHVKAFEAGIPIFEKDVPYELEEIRDFQESRSITGFLIKEKTITLDNEGNTREEVNLEEDSTILEKIFSYFSERPVFKTESGTVKTTWQLEVAPYTKKQIVVKTNYLLPLILLAVIIVGFAFTVRYQSQGLIVTKSATKAKSNKGTAFKVTIRVKNRKDAVRDLRVRDFFPKGLKAHEKFDFVKPQKITEGFVEWHLPLLQGGEERVFTYYIYTEEDLAGSISLPAANVNYLTLHRDPKTEHSAPVRVEVLRVIPPSPPSDVQQTSYGTGLAGHSVTGHGHFVGKK